MWLKVQSGQSSICMRPAVPGNGDVFQGDRPGRPWARQVLLWHRHALLDGLAVGRNWLRSPMYGGGCRGCQLSQCGRQVTQWKVVQKHGLEAWHPSNWMVQQHGPCLRALMETGWIWTCRGIAHSVHTLQPINLASQTGQQLYWPGMRVACNHPESWSNPLVSNTWLAICSWWWWAKYLADSWASMRTHPVSTYLFLGGPASSFCSLWDWEVISSLDCVDMKTLSKRRNNDFPQI